MHDGTIVVADLEVMAALAPLVALVEVVLPVSWDVAPFDGYIPVPISSGVFMEESCKYVKSVKQFFRICLHFCDRFQVLPRLCMNSWHRFPHEQ